MDTYTLVRMQQYVDITAHASLPFLVISFVGDTGCIFEIYLFIYLKITTQGRRPLTCCYKRKINTQIQSKNTEYTHRNG